MKPEALDTPGIPTPSDSDDFLNAFLDRVRTFRATDDTLYLLDHDENSLWLRRADGWSCLVSNALIVKTFGGRPSRFPVTYLGKGFFAFAETIPGTLTDQSDNPVPEARAITFLLDSKSKRIIEHSAPYAYDHNPTIRLPTTWITKYDLEDTTDH